LIWTNIGDQSGFRGGASLGFCRAITRSLFPKAIFVLVHA
jgi:hypothetical protein